MTRDLARDAANQSEQFSEILQQVEKRRLVRTLIWTLSLATVGLALLGTYAYVRAVQKEKADKLAQRQAELSLRQAQFAEKQVVMERQAREEAEMERVAAERRYETAVRNLSAHLIKGINAYHAKEYSNAVQEYKLALKADPGNPYVLDLMGYSLFKEGKYPQAIEALKASSTAPDYTWGLFDLARVYCADDKYDEASKTISMLLQRAPYMRAVVQRDGEFLRLCAPILKDMVPPNQ